MLGFLLGSVITYTVLRLYPEYLNITVETLTFKYWWNRK